MSTQAKGYLFLIREGKVTKGERMFMPCNHYHPDDQRFVVLSESPCKENGFKSATVMARYIDGEYYGVTTGDLLPVIRTRTVWTESSVAEGPYHIANSRYLTRYDDINYEDFQAATNHVNNLNMGTFGNPGYTVVNHYGIPVDSNGHLYF